ncbi:MAG TPA: hypothetical protein VK540_18220 [Polyangiaceae bacterium]|nr:hypothetical protein [Polyangiaceae bacterium]
MPENPCRVKRRGYVLAIATPPEHTIFLLSPAKLGGARADIVLGADAKSRLACELRSGGVPLGELFSFVSSLYFRGKVAYASAFARPPTDAPGALVITPGEGLLPLDARVTLDRLRTWATIAVDARNKRFTDPLLRQAVTLVRAHGATTRFVLLGSVASSKYVDPLVRAFGYRLFFPPDFVGRGDMSRGGLMLRAASSGEELTYAPVEGTALHGPRPARLTPRARS